MTDCIVFNLVITVVCTVLTEQSGMVFHGHLQERAAVAEMFVSGQY